MSKDLTRGRVVKGYRIASGLNRYSPYPYGSISMQLPFFRTLGLDLREFYPATINVNIFPKKFVLLNPDFTFRDVKWSEEYPAEDFSFLTCDLIYREKRYNGWIYYPHPETKSDHFHDSSTIEVICGYVKNLYYGSQIYIKTKNCIR